MKIQLMLGWGPREVLVFAWSAPPGATVQQALHHLQTLHPAFKAEVLGAWQVAVWGKPKSLDDGLHDLDRVEVLRGLRVDPKVARRERFQKQGARTAGLFAKRRVGAKPGY